MANTRSCPTPTRTVFYSWQSDSNEKLNRYFIESALDAAIRTLNKDPETVNLHQFPLVLDEDTKGQLQAGRLGFVVLPIHL